MTSDIGALPPRFGRYEVLGLIGRGSFADVARAWDEGLASYVAVKVLNTASSGDDLVRRRFVEEGQLLRRVHSEHVVSVHDIGELEDGRPYLVIDLAEGGTLADRLTSHGDQPVDRDTVARVVDALATGLEAIHNAAVVHRDIKPENLLIDGTAARGDVEADTVMSGGVLDPGERMLISDLGLAKDVSARGAMPSVIGGSARYQAPEQLRVDGVLGPPTDLYAASAVLWLLVSGRVAPEPHDVSSELILFRPGWQSFFARAMAMDADERFPTAAAWRAAVLDHLDAEPRALADGDTSQAYGRACPYKGLASFQAEDADVFFGREELVDDLLRRLQMNRVLVVAGPSGSGKSSAVRAGLLPALSSGALPGSERWRVELFTPGHDPIDELHYRLTRGSGAAPTITAADLRTDPRLARRLLDEAEHPDGWLLHIDQFEEAFTQPDDEATAAAFVSALSAIADPTDSRVRIVIAVRADFYGRCAQIPWLATRITENQVLVGPLSTENLRRAIEEPARRRGLRLEPGLVDAVLDEGGRSAASLPLISHALMETWARRDGNVLTFDGFRAAGGVAGAIARSADELFEEKFDERHKDAARRLLLRLVTPGEGTADTRRVMAIADLDRDADPEAMSAVVDQFVSARLLAVDDRSIEIAHEALIAGWPRLRDWVDAERGNLRFRQRVTRAANEWAAADRDADLLWRGTPLATAVEWLDGHGDDLDRVERDFVELAEAARMATDAEEEQARIRTQRTRRLATSALAVLTVASVVASIVALVAFQRARSNAAVAEQQFANALGTSAAGRATSDPAQALLLALESMARADRPGVEARSGLVTARLTMSTPGVYPLAPAVATPGSFQVALRPDGAVAAVADQTGPIRLYDLATGEQIGSDLTTHERGARTMAFTTDGETLVTGASDGLAVAWDMADPANVPAPRILHQSDVTTWAVAISPDDSTVAVADDLGVIRYIDLASGVETASVRWDAGAGITAVAFAPDGRSLIAANRDGRLNAYDLATGDVLWDTPTEAGPILWEIEFTPDGSRFATAGDGDVVTFHDAANGRPVPNGVLGEPGGSGSPVSRILGVTILPDGSRLLGGGAGGAVHSWDLTDLSAGPTTTLAHHADRVRHGALSADGTIYVTVGDDKGLRAWRTDEVALATALTEMPGGAYGAAFDPTGTRLAIGDGEGQLHLYAIGGTIGAPPEEIAVGAGHDGAVFDVAWADDGSAVATIGDDGVVRLWDPTTATVTAEVGRHQGSGRSIAFAPGGDVLVSSDRGDENGQGADVFVWDATDSSLDEMLEGHEQGVRSVAFSPDGTWLATADGRGEIRLWATDGWTLERQWRANEQINPVWALDFSSEGLLASVDSSEDLRVWDPETGEQIGRATGGVGSNGATGVSFDETGASVAVVARSGSVHLVDWRQGIDLAGGALPAHEADSFELAATADGEWFATTAVDGSVLLWDVLSRRRACQVAADRLDPAITGDLFATGDTVACE